MQNYPFISIIIPVKNEALLIGNCLKSLKQLNYPQDKLEIIISDGLSADNTVEIAKNYGAKIVKNEAQTVAPGRNVGFQNSKGERIAFSDADCVMDKNWLVNSLKYFEDKAVAGVGGPNINPQNESLFGRAVRFLFLFGSLASGSIYVSDSEKVKIVKNIPGCNAIYRREALEKVMPVDESLLTGDDVEMNYQLINKGYKILYTPDVVVLHYRKDDPKKFWRQIYRYAIGRLQLAKKHKDAINPVHIISGLFIPILFAIIIAIFIVLSLNPALLLFLAGIALGLIVVFTLFISIKEKSLKIVPNVFLAMAIFIFAWSAGFLRELLFPIKKTAGK